MHAKVSGAQPQNSGCYGVCFWYLLIKLSLAEETGPRQEVGEGTPGPLPPKFENAYTSILHQ